MRSAWRLIALSNRSMAVFEDDISYPVGTAPFALRAALCAFISDAERRGGRAGTLAYMGYYVRQSQCWATHAVWATPQAARTLLQRTEGCIRQRGVSVDWLMAELCQNATVGLRCTFAKLNKPHHQSEMDRSGGRFGGFLHQERRTLASYLHAANNSLLESPPRPHGASRKGSHGRKSD